MIRFDPTETVAHTDADLIVNTVNTVGVMGAGVAKAVKDRYPDVMPPYLEACRTKRLYTGGVQVLRMKDGKIVVNLASKKHFKDPSEMSWSGFGLFNLRRLLDLPQMSGVRSVLLPPPGAGLGGLPMEAVQRMMLTYMSGPAARGVDIRISTTALQIKPRPVVYAGIGSRRTSPETLEVMTEVARLLAEQSWILRSGNAEGADAAFEAGAPVHLLESYLPWAKDSVPHGIVHDSPEMAKLMQTTYTTESGTPWSPTMKRAVTQLMTRNGNQIFGTDFSEPSDVVICYTSHGDPVGGTRQAMKLADLAGVPILNLGLKQWQGARPEDIVSEAQRLVQERRALIQVPIAQIAPAPEPS